MVVLEATSKQSYMLTAINDDDLFFTPEMIAKIEHSQQQALEGKVTRVSGIEELEKFLDSL